MLDDQAQNRRVSAAEPDWSRERPRRLWDPSRRLLRSIRGWQEAKGAGGVLGALMRRLWVLEYRFWSAVTGADIPLTVSIEGGLLLPHPHGIVMHPKVRIGPNCLIFQQVTLGTREGRPGTPTLGGNVNVGAGARILGPLTIGDHARIGANAVVLCDVPPGHRAVGIPAQIFPPVGKGARDEA